MEKKTIICNFCGAENNIETGEFTLPEKSDAMSIRKLRKSNEELEEKNKNLLNGIEELKLKLKTDVGKEENAKNNGNGKKGILSDWL